MWHHPHKHTTFLPLNVPVNSLDLSFSHVCIVAVVEISEGCKDLLDQRHKAHVSTGKTAGFRPRPVHVGSYLQLDVNAHVLARARVIEQMEHGCDQRFVDAAQLTVDHALQDGAEASALGHHLRVLQSCTHT